MPRFILRFKDGNLIVFVLITVNIFTYARTRNARTHEPTHSNASYVEFVFKIEIYHCRT